MSSAVVARRAVLRESAELTDVYDRLIADFPELAPGTVVGQVVRARRDLRRVPRGEGLLEAVELVSRQRLVELVALRRG